jgi:hypothetical protein
MGVFSFALERSSRQRVSFPAATAPPVRLSARNSRILPPKQLPGKWVLSPFAGLTNVFWMTILSIVPKFEGFGAMPPAQAAVSKNK